MEKTIEHWNFTGDDDRHYEVELVQEYVSDRRGGWIEGMRRVELADGRHLQRIDDNTYRIIRNGVTIRRS